MTRRRPTASRIRFVLFMTFWAVVAIVYLLGFITGDSWIDGHRATPTIAPHVTYVAALPPVPRQPVDAASRSWQRVALVAPSANPPMSAARPNTSPSDQRHSRPTRSPVVVGATPTSGKAATGPNVARDYARTLVDQQQFNCLDPLWWHESKWIATAHNPYSSAFGVAQLLTERSTDPRVQVRDGLSYIAARYGDSCAAWAFWQRARWY